MLLSSLFVYNQMGGIDEAALDRLSLVTEMTKHIRVKAGEAHKHVQGCHPERSACKLHVNCPNAGEDSQDDLAGFTPAFLWLLRDFYLSLEEDAGGQARLPQGLKQHVSLLACHLSRAGAAQLLAPVHLQASPKDYLETALKPVKGSTAAAEAKNQVEMLVGLPSCKAACRAPTSQRCLVLQIRASIKALFPNRDCFTLVRPMSDERQLNQLESIDASQYRPEFKRVRGLCWLQLAQAA